MLIGQSPEKWGGWYWAHCPHPDCYWLHLSESYTDVKKALSKHRAETHRD